MPMASKDQPTLHGLVSEAANRHPRNRAVIFDDGEHVTSVTYDEMQEAAGHVRRMLHRAGCSEGQVIGLFYESSIMLPSCILGILQAGASFAPIDPRAPLDISQHFILSLNLVWVFLPTSLEQKFIQTYGETFAAQPTEDLVILSDGGYRLVKLSANGRPRSQCQSPGVHLAYAMHTSGTTGRPKIVRVPHQCIVPNVTHLSAIFSITPDDIIFMASPLTFDPSIVELFLALSNGAALLMVPDTTKLVPRRLMDALLRNQVSILQATPTLIYRFGIDLRQSLLSSATHLRVLAFGGEACPTLAQINHMRAADNATTKYYNLYGITEVSSWASCCQIDMQGNTEESFNSIPLGQPLSSTTLEVRDANGQTITEGEGELFIGSRSRVCLLDGEAWPVPLLGEGGVMRASGDTVRITDRGLVFAGRLDDQVKRNGKRFSLSQVKQTIETLRGLESCKLLLRPDGRLLLFCTLNQADGQNDGPPPPSSSTPADGEDLIRGLLRDTLPSHCLPDDVYLMDRFPSTLHGKVDWEALLRHAADETERRKRAAGDLNRVGSMQRGDLAVLWKRASRSASAPLDSTLFIQDSGGDSFQAVRLVNAVESQTGQTLPTLLDAILHGPFAHVLRHIQDQLLEKEETDSGKTSAESTTGASQTGSVTAKRATEQLLQSISREDNLQEPVVSSIGEKRNPSIDVSSRGASTVKYQRSDLGLTLESEHHRSTKRRKVKIDNPDPITEAVVDDTALSRSSKLSSEPFAQNWPIKRPQKTAPEFGMPDTAKHPCCLCACTTVRDCHAGTQNAKHNPANSCCLCACTTVQDCHAGTQNAKHNPANSCCLCACTTVPDCQAGTQNAKHDPANSCCLCACTTVRDCRAGTQNAKHDPASDAASVRHAVRRCSQMMTTRRKAARIKDDGLPSPEARGIAGANQINRPQQRGSVRLIQKWRYDTGKCVDASPLLVMDYRLEVVIYIGSHSHKFAAVSMATGKALWVTELGDRVESSACLSSCGSKVVVGCYDNCLYTLGADSGTVQWKFETQGPIKSSPVADRSSALIYVGSHDQHLYALDIEEQCCKWRLHCGGCSVFASPIIHYSTSTVYVSTLAGLLLAVDKETGAIRWTFNCRKPVFSSAAATMDSVLLGCVDGHLYCISHSGEELWRFSTDAPIFSSACVPCWAQPPVTSDISQCSVCCPSAANPCVVFGSHDQHVYCLSLPRGELRWSHKMPAAVYASPFIFRNRRLARRATTNHHTVLKGHRTVRDDAESGHIKDGACHTGQRPVPAQNSTCCCTTSEAPENRCGSQGCLFVAVCSTEGTVAILDLMSGEVTTSCQLPGEVFSSPVVVGDYLVVGCRDNFVYGVEIC